MDVQRHESVGFVGLGKMGQPMAVNLIKATSQLIVNDLSRDQMKALTSMGAEASETIQELVSKCSILVTMLPGPKEIEAAAFDVGRIVDSLRPGSLWIDASTNDPTLARSIATQVESRGSDFIDAPVTGGVSGATAGTLRLMVGGSDPAVKRATPLLSAMGREINHCGPVGTGCAMKLILNFLGLANTALTAEAMSFGLKAGLDIPTMLKTITGSWGDNGTVLDIVETSKVGGWGFSRLLAFKDISLAMSSAEAFGVRTDLMAATKAVVAGGGDLSGDLWEIIRGYEDHASVRIAG